MLTSTHDRIETLFEKNELEHLAWLVKYDQDQILREKSHQKPSLKLSWEQFSHRFEHDPAFAFKVEARILGIPFILGILFLYSRLF